MHDNNCHYFKIFVNYIGYGALYVLTIHERDF